MMEEILTRLVACPSVIGMSNALWRHPKVMITPHVASVTQPYTAARTLIDNNIRRRRAGQPMIGLMDRARRC
ncbi:putative dehydrogenase (fragment) [Bradyrhizobium sp. ORS 375]